MSRFVNISTNIGYLFASFIAKKSGKDQYGELLLVLVFISTLYHLDQRFFYSDAIVSVCVLFYSLWFLYITPGKIMIKILGVIFLLLMLACLLTNKKYGTEHYNIVHPFAHLFGGMAVILVALYGENDKLVMPSGGDI